MYFIQVSRPKLYFTRLYLNTCCFYNLQTPDSHFYWKELERIVKKLDATSVKLAVSFVILPRVRAHRNSLTVKAILTFVTLCIWVFSAIIMLVWSSCKYHMWIWCLIVVITCSLCLTYIDFVFDLLAGSILLVLLSLFNFWWFPLYMLTIFIALCREYLAMLMPPVEEEKL